MTLLGLAGVPLVGAGFSALLRRWPRAVAPVGVATVAACVILCRSLSPQTSVILWRQTWTLTASGQMLLMYLYAATAILLAISGIGRQSNAVAPAMLASLGALSAALLLQSAWLSLILLAAAMLLPALGCFSASTLSVRGATRYLIWVTLPIPFLLAIPLLLERVSLHPQEMVWYSRCAWLLLPAAVFWLNLFPFDAAMTLWANDAAPLMPAFVWVAQQMAALHMLLVFWRANPLLWTQPTSAVLRALTLLTTLLAGVFATIQLSPPAVLGSAAMATLGLAILGIVTGTETGLEASGMILATRSVGILLACVAHELCYQSPDDGGQPSSAGSKLATLLPLVVASVAVVGVVLLPRLPLLSSGTSALAVLAALEPRLPQLWLISTLGVVIGIGRTSWSLWRSRISRSSRRWDLFTVLLLGLLALCLLIALEPQLMTRIAAYILPA